MQENLRKLLDLYRDDERTKKLVALTSSDTPSRIKPEGAIGSLPAFLLTGAYMNDPKMHVFIGKDKDDAGYFKEDLQALFGQKSIHWFPDSFRRPKDFTRLETNNVLLRTETVNKITSNNALGEVVVTYPEALFEMVVAPEVLGENRIKVKVGEQLDVTFLIEILAEFGFERTDFVYEPGQFSVRGAIIDIFSYGNDWPYRVDLFDEEVESIRLFDPSTQLSKKNIAEVNIIPNINTRFEQSQKLSLLKVLPKDAVIWVRDVPMMLDALETCFEKAMTFGDLINEEEDDENRAALLKDRAFVRPDSVVADLARYHTIVFKAVDLNFKHDLLLQYNAKPQKSFNKNFKLLIEDLRESERNKNENFIFVPHAKQAERYYHIFDDLDANLNFHPVTNVIHEGFVDNDLNVALYTDHQIFNRFHRYNLKKGFSKSKAINLRLLRELTSGDYVTHIDHGVGKYSGLEKLNVNGKTQECIRLLYKNNDLLYVSIHSLHKISKFVGKDGKIPAVNKLGSDAWARVKRNTKKKIKDIAADLIKLYAKRKAAKGHAFPPDGYLQAELEASFLYEDTPDQFTATQAVKDDMMKEYPMDRLVCGDVGFGKTEIAIRAAFKAVVDGKQVAILVPTTILALQHYQTFHERLKDFGVTVDFINRFKTTKEKSIIFEKLKDGTIDLVIGTHGLLNKKVGFKDLGLLIIDEEQKFGVAAKEKLRNLKVNVDTLTLTATPIPRTLQFSLMSARDLSLIKTAPPNRQPIHTEVRMFNDDIIKESIYHEIYRGGQVFFVHNRVKSLPDIAAMVHRLCPDVDIAVAHGQMDPKKLEQTLVDFINRKSDVLVCTNIIETGLDIANANTIIINNAHHFGMSDLHQLRGRVGRSNRKAFCYLFSPPLSVLTSDARKRLQTLEEFSDLGSGFDIAMKDLDIRGAGNLLGGEQSGFIADIGYETYQKILDEAMQELRETAFKDLFKDEEKEDRQYVRDVMIETDAEMHIPDDYVTSIQERLNLYNLLDKLESEEEIEEYISQLTDRFGKVPRAVYNLFEALRIRWYCKLLGFDRVNWKGNKLRCYFINNPQSSFYETDHFNHLIAYVNGLGNRKLRFKQSVRHFFLVLDDCTSLKQAVQALKKINEGVRKKNSLKK
ncbi:MAG: transcription-repair coupling factor (superfamily II helicase) [Maribacter sp.]|jgi:transcription-repair coupling factor (superfamily II helicase)